jgi:hypothetical protein
MRSILSFLVIASFLAAQDAPSQEPRDERVQVLLKNGHSMIGIAKAGVRCERLVRGNFKPCSDLADRSAGVRVWYYQDLDGYIFLDSRVLERIEVLGKLTPEESRALADAIAMAHRSRIVQLPTSRPAARGEDGTGSRPAPVVDPNALTSDERALLERFPPEKGWSPEKFGELQRRKIVLHVAPSKEEQSFVDRFPDFQTAWKKWLATQPTTSAMGEAAPATGDKK